jgi:hypothetical protein
MEKETKPRGRKKNTKPAPQANELKLRVVNLHDYDLREIDRVELRTKRGETLIVGFHPTPVPEALSADDRVYIREVETKPYYTRYQLMFRSTTHETLDFDTAVFTSEEKLREGNHNPNYLYEF